MPTWWQNDINASEMASVEEDFLNRNESDAVVITFFFFICLCFFFHPTECGDFLNTDVTFRFRSDNLQNSLYGSPDIDAIDTRERFLF